MGKAHDLLAKRLAFILKKLNNGEYLDIKELATEFNVSIRTIQRDIQERLSIFPIKKENNKYHLEEYYLGKLNYEDIKSFATLSGIKNLYPNLNDEFILDILNNKLNKAFLVKSNGFENINNKYKEFELLSRAILKFNLVSFFYNSKQRFVEPYKLVNNNGIWYLLANENGNLKNYALLKIKLLKKLDKQTLKPKQHFLNKIEKNDSKWFSNTEIEVILEVNNKIKEHFFNQNYLSNQKVIECTKDIVIIKTIISYDKEIINLCMQWLPHIKILEPVQIQEKLETILKNYLGVTLPVIRECDTFVNKNTEV